MSVSPTPVEAFSASSSSDPNLPQTNKKWTIFIFGGIKRQPCWNRSSTSHCEDIKDFGIELWQKEDSMPQLRMAEDMFTSRGLLCMRGEGEWSGVSELVATGYHCLPERGNMAGLDMTDDGPHVWSSLCQQQDIAVFHHLRYRDGGGLSRGGWNVVGWTQVLIWRCLVWTESLPNFQFWERFHSISHTSVFSFVRPGERGWDYWPTECSER